VLIGLDTVRVVLSYGAQKCETERKTIIERKAYPREKVSGFANA